jgi:hypothetical protein
MKVRFANLLFACGIGSDDRFPRRLAAPGDSEHCSGAMDAAVMFGPELPFVSIGLRIATDQERRVCHTNPA